MPEPESNSPSFDFLNETDSPKSDEPAAAADEAMFDFGDDAPGEKPVERPAAENVSPAASEGDLAFFDDLLGDEAETTPTPAAAAESSSATSSSAPEANPDDSLFADLAETPVETPAAAAATTGAEDLAFFASEEDSPAVMTETSATAADDGGPTLDFLPEATDEDAVEPASDLQPPVGAELFAAAAVGAAAAALGEELAPAEPEAEAAVPPPPEPEIEEPQPTPSPLAEDHPHMRTYAKLCGHVRQAATLGAIESVLGWDERCMMPAAGAEQRAEQITLLSGLIHERLVDPRIGEWLNELADGELAKNPHDDFGATIRQIRRQYEKRTKLPKALVEELAHTAVMGQHVWQEARKNDDFASFAPLLTKMIDLKRQQAEALGYAETPYDALLDEFEPGELTSRVSAVLGALRDELVPLVAQVREGGRSPDLSILERKYPIETQRSFGRAAAAKIGFDFQRGRLDVTAHPFCTGLGPNDCRITTRYDEQFFNAGFFGILHEAGHGIYDQGLRADQYGLPVGEAVSMGIHESQSRLWEIFVGRSLPFWRHLYPEAKRAFAGALGDVTLGRFFFAVNDVRPSLIRVEADEYTYNLHILIRFELEQALIKGDLSVNDLQLAWQDKYREYLGLEVPNDADGVLQDIHWSAGLFGYFPTYSLGNLYAAQFYERADQELGGLEQRFARGEFDLLRRWLRAKIHREGQRYTAAELCERVTGKPLSHEPLMRHLRAKYELLYAPESASLDDLDVTVESSAATATDFGDEGYGLAADGPGGFGGASLGESMGFGGAGTAGTTVAAPAYKRKKEGGLLTALILLGGIVGGGILGTSLGYWILLWWKGPSADFLKIRDKLPSWIVPAGPPPEVEPEPVIPPRNSTTQPSAARPTCDDVGRVLTERLLHAARTRG